MSSLTVISYKTEQTISAGDIVKSNDGQHYRVVNEGRKLSLYLLEPQEVALALLQRDFPMNYQLATAPKPVTLYNWSNAPEWAMWAAVDKDGRGWWHGLEFDSRSWCVRYKEIYQEDILHNLPASQSLEKRPGVQ